MATTSPHLESGRKTGASPVDSAPGVDSKPMTEHELTDVLSDRPPTLRGPSGLGGSERTLELSELKAAALNDIVELRADVEKL